MTDVTRILARLEAGEPLATEELLPVVYDELRRIAARQIAEDRPGQTLQPTALVHEAYLRLLGPGQRRWESRGLFFAAAARAMRQILVDGARRRNSLKRGGGRQRVEVEVAQPDSGTDPVDLLTLDEALSKLAELDPRKARLVELRYFAGMTMEQAAAALEIAPATAHRDWLFARAWLHREVSGEPR